MLLSPGAGSPDTEDALEPRPDDSGSDTDDASESVGGCSGALGDSARVFAGVVAGAVSARLAAEARARVLAGMIVTRGIRAGSSGGVGGLLRVALALVVGSAARAAGASGAVGAAGSAGMGAVNGVLRSFSNGGWSRLGASRSEPPPRFILLIVDKPLRIRSRRVKPSTVAGR